MNLLSIAFKLPNRMIGSGIQWKFKTGGNVLCWRLARWLQTDGRVRLPRGKTNRGVLCYRSCIKDFLSAVHVCVCVHVWVEKSVSNHKQSFPCWARLRGEPRTWQTAQLLSWWIFERSQAYDKNWGGRWGEEEKKTKGKIASRSRSLTFISFVASGSFFSDLELFGDADCLKDRTVGRGRCLSEARLSERSSVSHRPPQNTTSRFFFYSFDISERELTEPSASNSAAAKGSLCSGSPFSWQQKKKHTHTPKRKQMSADLWETKPCDGFVIWGGGGVVESRELRGQCFSHRAGVKSEVFPSPWLQTVQYVGGFTELEQTIWRAPSEIRLSFSSNVIYLLHFFFFFFSISLFSFCLEPGSNGFRLPIYNVLGFQ